MDFSQHGGDTQTILNLVGESLFKKFYLSYSEKCPSEHNSMCPSEHNTQKVSFQTQYSKSVLPNTILKKCPSEHDAMCSSEHEDGIKLELKENCSSHIRVLPSN